MGIYQIRNCRPGSRGFHLLARILPVLSGMLFIFFGQMDAQWSYLGLGNRAIGEIRMFGDTIYVGTDNGIYKHFLGSTDTTWHAMGLQGKSIRTIRVNNGRELWAVRNLWKTGDSALVYKTSNAGQDWSVVFTSEMKGSGNSTDDMFDVMDGPPSSNDTIYLIDVGVEAMFLTTNGGVSWEKIHDIPWRYRFVKVDPFQSNRMWFGGEGMAFNPILYESQDRGRNWTEIDLGHVFEGDNSCHTIAFHESNINTWYIPGEGKVIKTTNNGFTWNVILENTFYNFDMAVSPARSNTVYCVGGPYVFMSDDGGAHWDTLAHAGFDDAMFALTDLEVVHRNNSDQVIVGGMYGVHMYERTVSGAGEAAISRPSRYQLFQNHPDPFNPLTTIRYALPVESRISLRVYNVLGQIVETLVDGIQEDGMKSAVWDATNIPSGIYFYCLDATSMANPSISFTTVRKMVLIK